MAFSYAGSPIAIRDDLTAAHSRVWERLGSPGTWFDATTRVEVAAELRNARHCTLCRRRKEAVSPYTLDGLHDGLGTLPESRVEIIHRIVTDPGRLTQSWYRRMLATGISEEEYVELVGLIAHVTVLDSFARAVGMSAQPLPEPKPGAPTRYRPAEARQHEHWVPTIAFEDHGPNEADMFPVKPANIRLAMTLVPAEARSFFDLSANQYLAGPKMFDFGHEFRAITHRQIELLAGRISALNQCHY